MRIIYVGRLIYAKGVQDLVSVCNHLWDYHDFDLKIVGDGVYRADLEDKVRLSYRNRITFTGALSHREVFTELRRSDIFVNPSYSEGLPTSVLEAAAVGLPVIATDVGGTREIIHDGDTGMLVAPRHPEYIRLDLVACMTHLDVARAMGQRAKVDVLSRFSWDAIEQQYVRLIEEVTQPKFAAPVR